MRYISFPFTRKFDMARLTIAWILALVLSASAHAASPTPESIERLMVLSQADKLFDAIKPRMESMMNTMGEQASQGAKIGPDEQKILNKFRADVMTVVISEMSLERMKPTLVQIYVTNFSQEEVDSIIAFYETPAGQSMIRKMPQVMQALMQEMQKIMAPSVEKMRKLSQEMQAELQALRKKK